MKSYSYLVLCVSKIQHTFSEAEVEQDTEGNEGDFIPTTAAMAALEKELQEALAEKFVVESTEASTESDDLIDTFE